MEENNDKSMKNQKILQHPQQLFDNMVRNRIYTSQYWKEKLFALTAESLVDQAINIQFIGGSYGGFKKPSNYQCLILKMLQIRPEKEIIMTFIDQEDYKYATALGLFYFRLIGQPKEIYEVLEKFYVDYRKIRLRQPDGRYKVIHIDELAHMLIKEEILFDVILPRIPKRYVLENEGLLDERISPLDDEINQELQQKTEYLKEKKEDKYAKKHWRQVIKQYNKQKENEEQKNIQNVQDNQPD